MVDSHADNDSLKFKHKTIRDVYIEQMSSCRYALTELPRLDRCPQKQKSRSGSRELFTFQTCFELEHYVGLDGSEIILVRKLFTVHEAVIQISLRLNPLIPNRPFSQEYVPGCLHG